MSNRPVASIAGASSGLGEAPADRLAAARYDLVLVAGRRERLRQVGDPLGVRGAAAEVVAADLSDRSELNRVVERVNVGDLQVVTRLAASEAAVTAGGNRSVLAGRYR